MVEADSQSGYEFTGFKQSKRDIRNLFLRASVAEELDRRRLFDMFHEGIVQKLVGLHLKMEQLECSDSTIVEIDQIKELIYSAIENAHILANEIAPHVLFKLGLKPALHELLRRYTKDCGLRYYLNIQDTDLTLLDKTTNLVSYNAVKRLLNGVVYSCQADMVGINMQTLDDVLEIVVQDNGSSVCDFQEIIFTGQSREQGFLLETAAQVCSLGGKAWIDKSAGMRTVCLVIPLKLGKNC